jgi:hypothetical protein
LQGKTIVQNETTLSNLTNGFNGERIGEKRPERNAEKQHGPLRKFYNFSHS